MKDLEIRSYGENAAPKVGEGSRIIEGYAIVFNQSSRVLYDIDKRRYFEEVVTPEAVTEDFLRSQDVILNRDHNNTLILGRSRFGSGSCELTIDSYGVRYKSEMPNTALGDETLEAIRRGDLFGSSFAFRYAKDGYIDNKGEDGIYRRKITKFAGIYDVSVVANPAYMGTSVGARAFDALDTPAEPKIDAEAQRKEENRKKLQRDLLVEEVSTIYGKKY